MKVRMFSTTELENALGTEMEGLASQLMKQIQNEEESGVQTVEVQTIESTQIGNLLAKMLSSESSLESDEVEIATVGDGETSGDASKAAYTAVQAQNIKVFKQLFAQALAPGSDEASSDESTDER